MVSVGVLAMLIKVAVLVAVSVASRLLEIIVRHFATAHLQRFHRAPVVHDSDTWLPNIPRSLFKYRRHPAILFTIFVAAALVASELVTELGVAVSEKCNVRRSTGRVIRSGDIRGNITSVENGASALLLQTIRFLDGPLTAVPTGLPVMVKPRICLSCHLHRSSDADAPLIAADCTVRTSTEYPPGALRVRVQTTIGPFQTISRGFVLPNDTLLDGMGDLTFNGAMYQIFTFTASAGPAKRATYLAYEDQAHCKELLDRSRDAHEAARLNETSAPRNDTGSDENSADGPVITQQTRGVVRSFDVHCTRNALSISHFVTALQVYRTIQLENSIVQTAAPGSAVTDDEGNEDGHPHTHAPSSEDVARAVLARKVIDDDATEGPVYEYVQCATYRWVYIVPFASAVCALVCLGLLGRLMRWRTATQRHRATGGNAENAQAHARVRGASVEVPYNSATWFMHAAAVGRGDGLAMRSGEHVLLLRDNGEDMWLEVCSTGTDGRVRRVRS